MGFPLRKPTIGITGWGEDVNQNWIDIEEALSGLLPIPGAAFDDDIDMLGHEILDVGDIELTGALTNLFAALDTRYYTESEVDQIVGGVLLNYWLSDTADGVIGDYNRLFDTDTGEAQSNIGPITLDADPKTIKNFVTAIDEPALTILSAGVYALDIHAKTTVGANVKAARLRWYLKKRTHPGAVETTLMTSEDSAILTDAEEHYVICATIAEQIELDATDRLTLLVVGVREGTEPQNPAVTIYMEGTCASRLSIRTTSAALDARYLRRDGSTQMEANLDMGTHDIVDVGLVDTVDVAALETDVDEFPDQLKQLLTVEIQQLENIGATTLSAAQWGFLGAQTGRVGLTDRGDFGAYDWSIGAGLTADGAYHELDMSAIVPAGARAVLLRFSLADNLASQRVYLRSADNTGTLNVAITRTQVANVIYDGTKTLPCSADRKIDYKITTGIDTFYLGVMSWWFE